MTSPLYGTASTMDVQICYRPLALGYIFFMFKGKLSLFLEGFAQSVRCGALVYICTVLGVSHNLTPLAAAPFIRAKLFQVYADFKLRSRWFSFTSWFSPLHLESYTFVFLVVWICLWLIREIFLMVHFAFNIGNFHIIDFWERWLLYQLLINILLFFLVLVLFTFS